MSFFFFLINFNRAFKIQTLTIVYPWKDWNVITFSNPTKLLHTKFVMDDFSCLLVWIKLLKIPSRIMSSTLPFLQRICDTMFSYNPCFMHHIVNKIIVIIIVFVTLPSPLIWWAWWHNTSIEKKYLQDLFHDPHIYPPPIQQLKMNHHGSQYTHTQTS